MRPNNEYTTENQRFFFPANAEAEHHESLDTSKLPNVEVLDGIDGYAIFEKPDGTEVAAEQTRGGYNMPAGSKITKFVTLNEYNVANEAQGRPFYHGDEFSVFAGKDGYILREGDLLMVAIDRSKLKINGKDDRIDENGVMLVKSGEPLPSLVGESILEDEEEDIRYTLLGVIRETDKQLINWHGRHSSVRHLVDYCVANALSKNRLEHALVVNALGFGSLVVEVNTNPAVAAYLGYIDALRGTNYRPTLDPHRKFEGFELAPLTPDERERRNLVGAAARRFMTEPRAGGEGEGVEQLERVDELVREFRKDAGEVDPEAGARARQKLVEHIESEER